MDDFPTVLQDCRQMADQGDATAALTRLRNGLRSGNPRPFEYDLAGQFLAKAAAMDVTPDSFPVFRIGILSDHTTAVLANAIRCALLEEGMLGAVYTAPFGAVYTEIFNENSVLYSAPRDALLLAFHHRNIEYPEQPLSTAEQAEDLAMRTVRRWEEAWTALRKRFVCPVFQHTMVPPGIAWLGSVEHRLPGAPDQFIERTNRLSRDRAPAFVHWVDTAGLAQRIGLRNWHDPRMFYYGKFGFSSQYVRDYMNIFLGAWRSATGRNRKCLVVDLDNTLWGGVVGDVGITELKLGAGTPEGEAYEYFCLYLKNLQQRGVMLAVCSKNDETTAREVFERHPHMPLKLTDFAAFCCNWVDKASNLSRLAQQLNIDLAHLAFVDDNPAECELVRQKLPDVAVIALPEDPSDFVSRVDEAHLFDTAHLSQEDLLRAQSYRARAQAEEVRLTAGNLDDYYADLRMIGKCFRAGDAEVERLAQMELKTNQFNLTTRRYDADRIRAGIRNDNMAVFACTLRDRLANHGIVSSVITRLEGQDIIIDSWLMSCRVFARTLEHFIMNALIDFARQNKTAHIIGEYRPAPKNKIVKELYGSLGFRMIGGNDVERWALSVSNATPLRTFVHSDGT